MFSDLGLTCLLSRGGRRDERGREREKETQRRKSTQTKYPRGDTMFWGGQSIGLSGRILGERDYVASGTSGMSGA